MLSDKLSVLDRTIMNSVNSDVPGAVLLITMDNSVVKHTAYGHSYLYDMGTRIEQPSAMRTDTLFDVASITKVMATTMAIMKLLSDNMINDLNDKVSKFLPDFASNGKAKLTIADLLSHSSGLSAWEPIYLDVQSREQVWHYLTELPLVYANGSKRLYSDFGFMVLAFLIEKITGQEFSQYLDSNIYHPLELKDICFKPNSRDNIAATSWGNPYEYKMIQEDNFGYLIDRHPGEFKQWRNYTLLGEANDGNAFYANEGVAGHAGLFATAKDLAVLGQIILDGGGLLLRRSVVRQFCCPQRFGYGYGFDIDVNNYMSNSCPVGTIGHLGFTGTALILSPKYDLQIILLTNRQNMGPNAQGEYADTRKLTSNIANIVFSSLKE